LGRTYDELISESVLADEDFIEIFPGADELYLEPIVGVSLSFSAESERFEAIFITLIKTMPNLAVYEGELPASYSLEMNQRDVHELKGEPWKSLGPIRMPEPMGETGGWDSYLLDGGFTSSHTVQFQYTVDMRVKTIVFALSGTSD
jgi:hypothetical protein